MALTDITAISFNFITIHEVIFIIFIYRSQFMVFNLQNIKKK